MEPGRYRGIHCLLFMGFRELLIFALEKKLRNISAIDGQINPDSCHNHVRCFHCVCAVSGQLALRKHHTPKAKRNNSEHDGSGTTWNWKFGPSSK